MRGVSSEEKIITDTDDGDIPLAEMTDKYTSTVHPTNQINNDTKILPHSLEKETPSCESLAKEFCNHTTAHGWGRVTRTRVKVVKILWISITLAALICNAGHIFLLVGHFTNFESEIRWRVAVSDILFPSVTICNTQPMSQSTLLEMRRDPSSLVAQWETVLDDLGHFDGIAAELNVSDEFDRIKYKLREPSGYFQNIQREYKKVGHQISDVVLSCMFMFKPCTAEDFSHFVHQDYFNCYTFNGGNISKETQVAKTTGPSAGLSMVLYLETNNGLNSYNKTYDKYLTIGDTAGVRVIVHSPNSRPYPLEAGFDIAPGFSASANLQVRNIKMLDTPYGNCLDDDEVNNLDIYKYSMSDCVLVCKQLYVIRTCQCISSMLPLPDGTRSSVPYCGHWDVHNTSDLLLFLERVSCEREAILNFTTEKTFIECKCPPTCNKFEYSHQLSTSTWPIQSSQAEFYETVILEHPNFESLKAYKNFENHSIESIIEQDLISKNFARLNVYIQDPIIEMYTQKPSYEWPNLASDIGGTFGLWIGMSLITWCEVVELVVKMLRNKLKGCYHNVNETKGVENEATEEQAED